MPWPELDLDKPLFMVTTVENRVAAIHGPFAPSALPAVANLLEPETPWLVQPDLSDLHTRFPMVSQADPTQLILSTRGGVSCEGGRYDSGRGALSMPVGREAAWQTLGAGDRFDVASEPSWARELEWTLPATEQSCAPTPPVFLPFGTELTMITPGLALPEDAVPFGAGSWYDLLAVSRVDQDRVLAAAPRVVYLFQRGAPIDSLEGPNVLPMVELFGDEPLGEGWYIISVLYLEHPRPRAVVLLRRPGSSVDPARVVFEVEVLPTGFGAVLYRHDSEGLAALEPLGASGYLAAGGSQILLREGDEDPVERMLANGNNLQRAYVVPGEDHIVLGGNLAYLWSGSKRALLDPEQLFPSDSRVANISAVQLRSAITRLTGALGTDGKEEVWASTFNTGLLRQHERGTWERGELAVMPRAVDCYGAADECGFVREARRHDVLASAPSGSLLLVAEDCDLPVFWSVRAGCGARPELPVPPATLRAQRREGPYLTFVGRGGLVLELTER